MSGLFEYIIRYGDTFRAFLNKPRRIRFTSITNDINMAHLVAAAVRLCAPRICTCKTFNVNYCVLMLIECEHSALALARR
jgi:hypothetical protein